MSRFTSLFIKNLLLLSIIAAEIAAIIFFCLYIPSLLPAAIAAGIVWLADVAAVTAMILRRNGEAGLSTALLVTALPVAGAALYFAFSCRGKGCGVYKAESGEQTGIYACAHDMCGTGAADCERAVYLKSGEEYFDLLFAEIAKAKRRVYLEYYIIGRGSIFERLITALKSAKLGGAEIKIVFDGLGSAFRLGGREIRRLKETGAEVKVFHRLSPLPRPRLNLRDHRKIAVADGAAFTGGINLADEYANIAAPYGMWKDTGVALYGGAAEMFAGMFMSVWQGSYSSEVPQHAKGEICMPYYDSPPALSGFYEDLCVWAIDGACERVHIFTPYFCPPERLMSALGLAARRGVDVKVIIPHIPDKRYAFETTLSFAQALIKSGVRFYEFTPGFMHAKSLICDGSLITGSHNFDYRSARINYECGVMLHGSAAEQAERDFEECLRLSAPVRQIECGFMRKVLRAALRVLYPLM